MPSVSLRAITRTHPARRASATVMAVRELSLEIADGELLVLLGPSGSGKTTTLRLIAGLDVPDSGTLHIDGRDMRGVPAHERGLSMVFQDHPLLPHLSARENIGFGLRLAHRPAREIEERVAEWAESLGLGVLLDRRPETLSGGERQRVALAAALVRRPRLLLLDEPLGQLDAPLRLRMRAEIRRLQRDSGLTIIHVTHDQSEAMALADRLVVLRGGEVQQIARPPDAYERPANAFVAQFLGNPPMNLIPGRIEITNGTPTWCPRHGRPWPVSDPLPATAGGWHLGIRPEDVRLGEPPAATPSLPARIELVEFLGDHSLVHLRVDGELLMARAESAEGLCATTETRVWFPPGSTHFFHEESGLRWIG